MHKYKVQIFRLIGGQKNKDFTLCGKNTTRYIHASNDVQQSEVGIRYDSTFGPDFWL